MASLYRCWSTFKVLKYDKGRTEKRSFPTVVQQLWHERPDLNPFCVVYYQCDFKATLLDLRTFISPHINGTTTTYLLVLIEELC